jgi:predicted DNA-binding protein (MmcQ/YjbR family)
MRAAQMMDIEWLRRICLALPHTTEQIQWGNDLLFKVHGKMFAVTPLEPAAVCLSFKCSEESFAELTERPNIIPAPYLARAKWVALQTCDALTRDELTQLLRTSYQLVLAKLPRRLQQAGVNPKQAHKKATKRMASATKTKKRRPER